VFREDSGFADTDRSRERGDADWSLGSARWSRLRSGIMASEDAGRRRFRSPLIPPPFKGAPKPPKIWKKNDFGNAGAYRPVGREADRTGTFWVGPRLRPRRLGGMFSRSPS